MSAEDQCLKLLKETNKPYNVQGVADMLASQGVKKAQADRALTSLAEEGKILVKEFGKIKIYFPSQDGMPVLAPEEKAARLEEIKNLSQELKACDETIAGLKKELAASNSSLTLEQLQERFERLQELAETLDKKLAILRSGQGPKVSASDIASTEARLSKMLDTWACRRRIFKNIWDAISENMDEKQSSVFEDIGIETDEACGEILATYQKLLTQSKKTKTGNK